MGHRAKTRRLAASTLAMLLFSTAGMTLTPLSKDQIDAIKKEWRAAPFHVQVEVLTIQHLPKLDAARCGEITAVVRRIFRGGERFPLGSALTFDNCIYPMDLEFTNFDREFQPGQKLEAVLTDDPTADGKVRIVSNGMMRIRELSGKPQLNLDQ